MTPDIALEICRRTKSAVLVTGSISDEGNHYAILLKAMNCQTGKEWTEADVAADSRNQVVHALGEDGYQLRSRLGEPKNLLREFNQPLDVATSASLEALQAYTQGWRKQATQGESARFFISNEQWILIQGLLKPTLSLRWPTRICKTLPQRTRVSRQPSNFATG